MAPDVFAVVAEPQRRRILEQLRAGHASVGELVDQLALPQPTVSKHPRSTAPTPANFRCGRRTPRTGSSERSVPQP